MQNDKVFIIDKAVEVDDVSTPKKDNKPDESEGSPNHMFSSGRSEDFQKIYECLMSHMRLQYDNGDDIAAAIDALAIRLPIPFWSLHSMQGVANSSCLML